MYWSVYRVIVLRKMDRLAGLSCLFQQEFLIVVLILIWIYVRYSNDLCINCVIRIIKIFPITSWTVNSPLPQSFNHTLRFIIISVRLNLPCGYERWFFDFCRSFPFLFRHGAVQLHQFMILSGSQESQLNQYTVISAHKRWFLRWRCTVYLL